MPPILSNCTRFCLLALASCTTLGCLGPSWSSLDTSEEGPLISRVRPANTPAVVSDPYDDSRDEVSPGRQRPQTSKEEEQPTAKEQGLGAKSSAPKLDDLLDDLESLRAESPQRYQALKDMIDRSSEDVPAPQQAYLPRLAATLSGHVAPPPEAPQLPPEQPVPPATASISDGPVPATANNLRPPATVPPTGKPAVQQSPVAAAAVKAGELNSVAATVARASASPLAAVGSSLTTPPDLREDVAADHADPNPGEWKKPFAEAVLALEREIAGIASSDEEKAALETQLRLLYVVANHREKAVEPIEALDSAEQEFWTQQMYGLLVSLDAEERHTSSRRAALTLRHLRRATSHLADISTLDVRNLKFCTDVQSYGRYVEFKSRSFRPGQEVVVYVELDNFAVEDLGTEYETELAAEYAIFDADNRRVAQVALPLDKQTCHNRRQDYFIAYLLHLPDDLADGDYTFVLTIEDVKGKKSNQAQADFRIR